MTKQQQISLRELRGQLKVAKAEVKALEEANNTSAAAAYYSIQLTLERFIRNY